MKNTGKEAVADTKKKRSGKMPTANSIKKKADFWFNRQKASFERAEESIDFIQLGNQWDSDTKAIREGNNKEVIMANLCRKYLERTKEKSKELQYTLSVSAVGDQPKEESKAFKRLLNHLALNDQIREVFDDAVDIVHDQGASVTYVDYDYENCDTLNRVPVVKTLKDNPTPFK